ncbi:hypothetical protein [Desulfosporosinus sp. SYSU MS00001]
MNCRPSIITERLFQIRSCRGNVNNAAIDLEEIQTIASVCDNFKE